MSPNANYYEHLYAGDIGTYLSSKYDDVNDFDNSYRKPKTHVSTFLNAKLLSVVYAPPAA